MRNSRTSHNDDYYYLTFGKTRLNFNNLIELIKIAFTDENGEFIDVLTGISSDDKAHQILNKFNNSHIDSKVEIKKRGVTARLREYFQEASRIGMCVVDADTDRVTPTKPFKAIYFGAKVEDVFDKIFLQYRFFNPSVTYYENKALPFINLYKIMKLAQKDDVSERVSDYDGLYADELILVFAMKDNSDEHVLFVWNLIKKLRHKYGLKRKSNEVIRDALKEMGIDCKAKDLNYIRKEYISFISLGSLFEVRGCYNELIRINPRAVGKWEQLEPLYVDNVSYVPEGYDMFSKRRDTKGHPELLWGEIDESIYWNDIVYNTYIPYEKDEQNQLKLIRTMEQFHGIISDESKSIDERQYKIDQLGRYIDRDLHLQKVQELSLTYDKIISAKRNEQDSYADALLASSYSDEFEIDCLLKIDMIPGMRERLAINGELGGGIVRGHAPGGDKGADGIYYTSDNRLLTIEPFNAVNKKYQREEIENAEEHASNIFKVHKKDYIEAYSILIAPTIVRTTISCIKGMRRDGDTNIKLIPLNTKTWIDITNNSTSEEEFMHYIEEIDNLYMNSSFDDYEEYLNK